MSEIIYLNPSRRIHAADATDGAISVLIYEGSTKYRFDLTDSRVIHWEGEWGHDVELAIASFGYEGPQGASIYPGFLDCLRMSTGDGGVYVYRVRSPFEKDFLTLLATLGFAAPIKSNMPHDIQLMTKLRLAAHFSYKRVRDNH